MNPQGCRNRPKHTPWPRDERGAALIIALLMLVGLAAMAMAAVWIGSTDLVVAGGGRQRAEALHTAEAGLAEAMHRMSQSPGTMANIGGQDIDISIQDPSDPPNPNWTARIFKTSPAAAPAGGGAAEFHTGTLQPAGDYLDYSHESDEDRALTIRHKLRDFDGDGSDEIAFYDPSQVPPENPTDGWPIERITVTGSAGQALRVVQADVIRFPLNPNVFAAMMANGEVDLRGNVTVCGHNHRMDTPPGTRLPGCSPAWDEPDGHLVAVQTASGAPVGTRGSTDLLGSPSPTDTDPANTFQSISEALGLTDQEWQDVVANADRTSAGDPNPWEGITVLTGDHNLNGVIGSGLLYVNGDLRTGGGFEWTGLIYVEGQMRNSGNSWVLGGVMARGGSEAIAVDFGAGSPAVLYSRQALVQSLMSAMGYIILSWKEL